MKTRTPVSPRLFNVFSEDDDLVNPGEYGSPDKPDGWVMLQVKELNEQKIYLTSLNYRKKLAKHHGIADANIVSLIDAAPKSKKGIPEEILAGDKGLAIFQERLHKIIDSRESVLIHCKRGSNRTPVAAVIYLVNRGLAPHRAVELVTDAYRKQRDPEFILNSYHHYSMVLAQAGVVEENHKTSRQNRYARHLL